MKTILTLQDLFTIQSLLEVNGFGEIPLTIQTEVLTKERLRQINETINSYDTLNEQKNINEDLEQINVKIGNIEFQYKLFEENED